MVGRRQRHQMLGSPVGVTSQKATGPCAACKLRRRRCTRDCPFYPYFSPHEPQKFASVHKVFGASNVSKMLMEVPEARRVDTANSLIYEASVRLRDPVYGCMGAISALQRQIQSLHAELVAIKAEILKYKLIEEAANNLATISTNHTWSNFISPSAPSSLGDVVASFGPLPQPQLLVSPATSAATLIDPMVISEHYGGGGYSNRSVYENDNYIGRCFH